MKMVYGILLDSALILIFILVFLAFCYSALILFKPKLALVLNGRFNAWFSTEKLDGSLDKHIDTNEILEKNRWWIGSVFLVGAQLCLKYLIIDFDANKFIALVVNPSGNSARTLSEIIVISTQWLLVFTSFVGVLACGLFLANPDSFQRISQKMDTHYSTEKIKSNADTIYTAVDEWVVKNHVLAGLLLFLGSTYLVVVLLMLLV